MARKNKFTYLHVIQGNYGYGWEDETAEEKLSEAQKRLREYKENGPGIYKVILRRVLNES